MSKRNYDLFGPFNIPRTDNLQRVDKKGLREFWREVETENESNRGLATARGCYIFGIRAGKGATPWYVGKATKTFRQECFTSHKLVHYNDVLLNRKGTPVLFLLARMTPTGKFIKTLKAPEANWVERILIHHCLNANSELCNVSGTALSSEVVIPGLLNNPRGQPSEASQNLRKLLSLR